ncbi:hypothetical protein C8N43_0221 [Litoreibacter ponti]|uniref:Thioredoxin domain-containing protein n=1 Tax=Litoreibacter ponti TaxID=1510457 RepID=A0A2T6BHQ4_9RHOB|nr:hypothetical protein [Litoreibacter ponti]PTX55582.1 hypothetical protein C8N43_0221 [Litoreibacter ponti]
MRALQETSWPQNLRDKAMRQDQRVLTVWPGSPAEALGIKPGWHLLQIDMEPPSPAKIRAARGNGVNGMAFLDPDSGAIHTLEAGPWPFGLHLIPRVNDGLIEGIRSRNYDVAALNTLWSQGNWKDFEALRAPLEDAALPKGLPFFSKRPKDPDALTRKIGTLDVPDLQLFLALSHLAGGDVAGCDFYLRARRDARERMGLQDDLLDHDALELFMDALILWNRGRREEAKTVAGQMLATAPRNKGAIALYCQLMGSDPLRYWPPEMREPFPINYALPQHDPFGQWPEGGTVRLEDTIAAMAPGQLHLVYSLSWYRTNGPMQWEFETLIPLYQMDPDRIASIDLITAIDNPNSHWIDKNQIEDRARAAGLPVRVLFDQPDHVAEDLGCIEAPQLYLLDHKGRVLSMEKLANEEGYWQALSVMKTL